MMDRRQLEDALAASERATRLLRDALGLSPRVIADSRGEMNLKQAADYMGVSCDTLRRRARSGTVGSKPMGSWRFHISDLDRLKG